MARDAKQDAKWIRQQEFDPDAGLDEELAEWLAADDEEIAANSHGAIRPRYIHDRLIGFILHSRNRGLSYSQMQKVSGVATSTLANAWGRYDKYRKRDRRRAPHPVEAAIIRERERRRQELDETPLPDETFRSFTRALLEGKGVEEAAVDAGVPKKDAKVYSERELAKPDHRDFVIQCFGAAGFTHANAAGKLINLMDAEKLGTGGRMVPDNTNRIRAIELYLRVIGALPGTEIEQEEADFDGVRITVTETYRKRLDVFRVKAPGRGGFFGDKKEEDAAEVVDVPST